MDVNKLYCFPDIKTLKFGVDGPRDVRTQNEALAPQREFPPEIVAETEEYIDIAMPTHLEEPK